MWFYITMFLCNLLVPLIMLIGGYCMYKHPPKKINNIVGYRTAMSKKNKENWKFAHEYCGKLWMKLGLLLLLPTIVVQLPFAHSSDDVIGTMSLILETVQIAVLLGSIVLVEKALKKNSDTNDIRK